MFTDDELEIIKTCLHEAIIDGNGTPEMAALVGKISGMLPAATDDEEEDSDYV